MLIKIAWRNIWRSKLRSSILLAAIAIGLLAGIFSMAMSFGLIDQKMSLALDTQVAHIEIAQKDFKNDFNIAKWIKEDDLPLDKILQHEKVVGLAKRIVVSGMGATGSASQGLQIQGIELEKEKAVRNMEKYLVEGEYFSDKRNQVLISSRLAEKLKLKIRSKIIITFLDAEKDITGAAFRVVGIFKTGSTLFDEANVFVKEEDLRKLALLPPNTWHQYALKLEDPSLSKEVMTELSQANSALTNTDFTMKDWLELEPELAYLNEFSGVSMMIFLGIILLGLAFGILNTMLMAVLERIREFGVLMAVGMGKFSVFNMVVIETIMLSFTGGVIGALLGIPLVNYWGERGIDLSQFAEGFAAYGVGDQVYPILPSEFYVYLALMVIATSIFSAIYPALKAIKLDPANAIRAK